MRTGFGSERDCIGGLMCVVRMRSPVRACRAIDAPSALRIPTGRSAALVAGVALVSVRVVLPVGAFDGGGFHVSAGRVAMPQS
jgi:hypothetical protein